MVCVTYRLRCSIDDTDPRALDGDLPETPDIVHHVQDLSLLVHLDLSGPHGQVKVHHGHEVVGVNFVGLASPVSWIPLLQNRRRWRREREREREQ